MDARAGFSQSCRRSMQMQSGRSHASSGSRSACGTTDAGVEAMAIAEKKSASVEQVLTGWKEQGIRNVRFELPDMHGTSRAKLVPIKHAARYASDALHMYGGAAGL